MYFFLLPARFEGGRFAPGNVEKWIVIGGIALAIFAFATFAYSIGGYSEPPNFWLYILPWVVGIYLVLLPVRMMMRVKIFPVESRFFISVILVGLVVWLILPDVSAVKPIR